MPGGGDNGEFAFVTIDAEVLGRFMVRVQASDRNNLHTRTKDSKAVELFLQPELLEAHFTATFYLAFVLTAFFLLNLDGALRAAVLELDLRAYAPTVAEVVT